jgi:adenylosuccinate lyase
VSQQRDIYDSLSPIDYRYWDEKVAEYLSENGFTRAKLEVEQALVRSLAAHGLCPPEVVEEIAAACQKVTTAEVYEEEGRIKHDIRALVNCIRKQVSDTAKPFVHMTATSYDIVDTANAYRYRKAIQHAVTPALASLLHTLIDLTIREADTVQVGRTHGQHAVPITFGFALAGYVSRLGQAIEQLQERADQLTGKFSGAVGAYNASSLFFENPEAFEWQVMQELGLQPAEHSTQVAPPEAMTRLLAEVAITGGILANLADDLRHLQRTEIAEVGEQFVADQVGSSTMPQKRNPINFENAKSLWKIIAPRLTTALIDQISEHQRDLTNSASGRTYGEMVAYLVSTAKRLDRTIQKLAVHPGNLQLNLMKQEGLVLAEPLYITLAALGHPDAHEKVRALTLQAQQLGRPLQDVAVSDPELRPYYDRMTDDQRRVLSDPAQYTGIAAQKARSVAERWRERIRSH